MGLDTYAVHTPEDGLTEDDVQAFDRAGIELYGGIYSGEGGSFRGKVYDLLILDLTGISLYQAWIPPEIVRQMAEALQRVDPDDFERNIAGNYPWEDYSRDTLENLGKFFDICAARGLGLVGSW